MIEKSEVDTSWADTTNYLFINVDSINTSLNFRLPKPFKEFGKGMFYKIEKELDKQRLKLLSKESADRVSKPKPKYKCPNGCENTSFYYTYRLRIIIVWARTTMDEYGKITYNKNPYTITDYYDCSKCNKRFTEQQLIDAAREFNGK